MSVRFDDLIITIAYFSIPVQIVCALYKYPSLTSMSWRIVILAILFALFIFLCGTGHLFRCLGDTQGLAFELLNGCTALISLATAIYLLPLIPDLCGSLEKTLEAETESKRKLMTFMSFLCHEIRNPLFAITSTITFLGDDQTLTNEQLSGLDCINQSANLMLRLVNDVLDISKLESGKLQLEQIAFDLKSLMQGTAKCFRTEIEQKRQGRVQFDFQIGPEVPQVVIGDSVRLLQISYNLLSNAAKFTEQGFVKYSIDTVSEKTAVAKGWITNKENDEEEKEALDTKEGSADFSLGLLAAVEEGRGTEYSGDFQHKDIHTPVTLRLQVQDSGPGIAPERLKTIFEPYTQSKLSDYRKHGGTGLGLSILDNLTQTMGGSIHVESQLGEGSTFTVYVPVKVPTKHNLDDCLQAQGIANNDLVNRRMQEILSDSMTIMEQDSASFLDCPGVETAKKRTITTTGKTSLLECSVETTSTSVSSPQIFDFPLNQNIVLVVDDNAINRKLLGRMLSHFNVQYDEANNGQEAVDFMKQSRNYTDDLQAPRVGLVLMDWSMPVMDGCEAIQVIRRLGIKVPIVAVTACALDEGEQQFMDSGADEFATKPLLRDDLYTKCRRYLLRK